MKKALYPRAQGSFDRHCLLVDAATNSLTSKPVGFARGAMILRTEAEILNADGEHAVDVV